MSGLPMLANYKHVKTICEQTFDNSPNVSKSSSSNWWSSIQSVETWYYCSMFLLSNSQYLSTHVFACPSVSAEMKHSSTTLSCHPRRRRETSPVRGARTNIPRFESFRRRFLSRPSQMVVPTINLLMGVRANFFREVPRGS